MGRFASPDTIVPDPGNPQSFNRYSYVLNSPTNYTDPTGHCIFGLDTAICVAAAIGAGTSLIVDYGIQAYSNYQTGMSVGEALNPNNISIAQLAGSTIAGGIGGAIVGPLASVAAKSAFLARISTVAVGGAIGGIVGGQVGDLTQATVQELEDYYYGYGFQADKILAQASTTGFLDPNTIMLDAATGAAFAVAGESLISAMRGFSSARAHSNALPIIGFEPVVGEGLRGTIYFQDSQVHLTPSQLQAFLNALAQNSQQAASELLVKWFGTTLFDD